MGFGTVISRVFSSTKLKKRKYDPEMMSIDDLKLPLIYDNFEESRVLKDIKSELNTYRSLGYRNKQKDVLEKEVYHSYQMGLLLKAIQMNLELEITKKEDYFTKDASEVTNETVYFLAHDIIKKYDLTVSKTLSEKLLFKEIIWTANEASILLNYLSFYKKEKVVNE